MLSRYLPYEKSSLGVGQNVVLSFYSEHGGTGYLNCLLNAQNLDLKYQGRIRGNDLRAAMTVSEGWGNP